MLAMNRQPSSSAMVVKPQLARGRTAPAVQQQPRRSVVAPTLNRARSVQNQQGKHRGTGSRRRTAEQTAQIRRGATRSPKRSSLSPTSAHRRAPPPLKPSSPSKPAAATSLSPPRGLVGRLVGLTRGASKPTELKEEEPAPSGTDMMWFRRSFASSITLGHDFDSQFIKEIDEEEDCGCHRQQDDDVPPPLFGTIQPPDLGVPRSKSFGTAVKRDLLDETDHSKKTKDSSTTYNNNMDDTEHTATEDSRDITENPMEKDVSSNSNSACTECGRDGDCVVDGPRPFNTSFQRRPPSVVPECVDDDDDQTPKM